MITVWCVEDDKSILDIELYTLKTTGFDAKGFPDGKTFFEALKKEKPEIVLLDIMLPDMDGVQILKNIRQTYSISDIPVIMATAKGMEYDKIQSLDLGADDYLVKPFGMMEMVSRIKAVRRRYQPKYTDVLKYGGLEVFDDQRIVKVDGVETELTYKEFELLKMFLTNIGTVLTRDKISIDAWGTDFVGESRTIDVHIRTLRQKIGCYGDNIKTVRNVGYRMEALKQ